MSYNKRLLAFEPAARPLTIEPRHFASVAADQATRNFDLRSDGTPAGNQAVADMAAVCEQDYATQKGLFASPGVARVLQPGTVSNATFVVHVDQTAGGAYHYSCAGTEIWVIPDDAASLLVAEVVECFEAAAAGWNCGQTNGEGLSRVLAAEVRPFKVLTGIDGDVQGWYATKTDFVNDNSASDRDLAADACGSLFLYYLRYQLGYDWKTVAAHGAQTLGLTYHLLTGHTGQQGFSDFLATLKKVENPDGSLRVPPSGNPFPVGAPPQPPPPPPPPTGGGCNPFGWLFRG